VINDHGFVLGGANPGSNVGVLVQLLRANGPLTLIQ
jgi:hypothetical protein